MKTSSAIVCEHCRDGPLSGLGQLAVSWCWHGITRLGWEDVGSSEEWMGTHKVEWVQRQTLSVDFQKCPQSVQWLSPQDRACCYSSAAGGPEDRGDSEIQQFLQPCSLCRDSPICLMMLCTTDDGIPASIQVYVDTCQFASILLETLVMFFAPNLVTNLLSIMLISLLNDLIDLSLFSITLYAFPATCSLHQSIKIVFKKNDQNFSVYTYALLSFYCLALLWAICKSL